MTEPTTSLQMVTTYGVVVGQVLVRERKERGLSQGAVAEALGSRQSVVSRLETSTLQLTVSTLGRWCEFLRITPAHVMAGVAEAICRLQAHGVTVLYDVPPAVVHRSGEATMLLLEAGAVGALIDLKAG